MKIGLFIKQHLERVKEDYGYHIFLSWQKYSGRLRSYDSFRSYLWRLQQNKMLKVVRVDKSGRFPRKYLAITAIGKKATDRMWISGFSG